jgi:hypothetical protein
LPNSLDFNSLRNLSAKASIFPLLAFAVPFLLRAIPEALMGPYVVGFDTMGHYVPTTVLWLREGVDLWRYIATAPLFYSLIVSLVALGGPLIAVLKIIPVVLHGFLGLSIYGYAKKGLQWSPKKSAFTALIATAYFVALRISWDLLRNELALIFFFAVLTLLAAGNNGEHPWKRYVLLLLAMVAVVLAHQLVTILMLGLVALTIAQKAFRKNLFEAVRLAAVALPAALLFFAILYFSPAVSEFRVIFGFPSSSDGWLQLFGFPSYLAMVANEAGFFLYCFLLILPFVVLSFRRFRNFQMRTWILLIIIASLVPMVSPSNLRWIMMLTYPFAFYVAEALSRLRSVGWKRFKLTAQRVAVAYLVLSTAVLSLGFMVMTPENPSFYFKAGLFNGYIYQIPSSMLQNTVSITDCRGTADALQWFKGNLDEDAVLLTHRAFYGWALLTLKGDQVVLYEYDNPEIKAEMLVQEGRNRLYLIWWISGQGWYGQPAVPAAFQEVYRSGRISIYAYSPAN